MKLRIRPFTLAAIPLLSVLWSSPALATLPLETESARIMPQGTLKLESAFEWQTSDQGREVGVPLVIEYAFTKDFELEVEPTPYTGIFPKIGPKSQGVGDTEATAIMRFIGEQGWVPNFALAGEVKFPTARDMNIGTGEFDSTWYLIISKRFFDRVDLHLNAGYTFVGSPPGVKLMNTFDYAAAIDFHATPKLDLLAEIIGNTTSLSNAENGGEVTGVTPEASGGETAGLLGVRYQILPGFFPSLGVTYDNQGAVLIRAGLTWKYPLFPQEAASPPPASAPEPAPAPSQLSPTARSQPSPMAPNPT